MFTGIIEDLGKVEFIEKRLGISRISIRSSILVDQKIGDSISVNGVCLTIADLKKDVASFDVMDETMKRSDLNTLKGLDLVNLERALRVGDRLGGHFVTGHIDCVGRIIEKSDKIKIGIPQEYRKFIVAKGSVALDGISLTVGEVGKTDFTVYIIPHTLNNTTLGFKKRQDHLNIEFDILGKYALNQNPNQSKTPQVTKELLQKKGFS